MEEIIKKWNIESTPVPVYHSAWDINNSYILKVYDNPAALQRNIVIMRALYEAGIPVPKIIKLPDGRDYLEDKDRSYVLTTKLKGRNITNLNECDDGWFFEFGTILAKLHIAFQACEEHISCWKGSLLEEMNGWVSDNLSDFKAEYLEMGDIEDSINELAEIYDDLPKQLIHRDVHLGNFLFDGGVFSGYIDFDLSQSNIRIFDLSYFLLGLRLEGDNRLEEKRWYEIIGLVMKGYDSITALAEPERNAVVCVMKNIELLFTAYFLGIGDKKLAKGSADLFSFVKRNEERIQQAMI